MFNKVGLSTIDYTTGRAPQPLSVPLAALKTVFPKTWGGFTEMLLRRDTHSLPGFVWVVLPRSGPKTNCSRKRYLPQGSTALQRGCCYLCSFTCGACDIFKSVISLHRLVRKAPGPIPRKSSKRGQVVSKNTTG